MIHTEFIQGTDEWKRYKLGKISASRIIDIMPGAKGYRAARDNYLAELAAEITTGQFTEHFTSSAMEHGTLTEPQARAAYEIETGFLVSECGFIDHLAIENAGASPDGLIYNGDKLTGGIEIKCPNTATHITTLESGKIKPDYIFQMHFCMMCADVYWWDFVSFDHRLPENCQLFIKRVKRDEMLCRQIEAEVFKFKSELDYKVEFLKNYKG